jgi:hypothetical protein
MRLSVAKIGNKLRAAGRHYIPVWAGNTYPDNNILELGVNYFSEKGVAKIRQGPQRALQNQARLSFMNKIENKMGITAPERHS